MRFNKLLVCVLFILFVGINLSYSAEVSLMWDYPQPPADLSGFRVYYGQTSRGNIAQPTRPFANVLKLGEDPAPYSNFIQIPFVLGNYTTTVSNLNAGNTYFFAATAFDSSQNESVFSNEVSINIPVPQDTTAPPAPQNVHITIVKRSDGSIIIDLTVGP